MRKGITLLEVIISMAVLAIGLTGLFALIPVGAFYMHKANVADASATLGNSGFRDATVRDWLYPRGWVYADGTSVTVTSPDPDLDGTLTAPPLAGRDPSFWVIDPLAVTRNAATPAVAISFPDPITVPTGAPHIARLGLKSNPGSTTLMNARMVDRIFRTQDDQPYVLPPDPESRPRLPFMDPKDLPPGVPPPGPPYPPNGLFSFLFTVQPTVSEFTTRPADVRHFTVSTVVSHRRDTSLPVIGLPPEERMLFCEVTAGTTINEFMLRNPTRDLVPSLTGPDYPAGNPLPKEYVRPKAGEWILLLATEATPFGTATRGHWVHVGNVGEPELDSKTDPTKPTWTCRVSLNGDFTATAAMSDVYPASSNPTVWAVLMPSVTAVYVKNVELATNSQWH